MEKIKLILVSISFIILCLALYFQSRTEVQNDNNTILTADSAVILDTIFESEYTKNESSFEVEIVPRSTPQAVIDTALRYKNVVDFDGKKTEPIIQKFLKSVGLSGNQPYCQAFVYYCHLVNGITEFRTGLANGYYNSVKKKYGDFRGRVQNKQGVIVWKEVETDRGHTAFITRLSIGNRIKTIEGNTSYDKSSTDARIYAGMTGVYEKQRLIGDNGKQKLRGVIQ